MTQARVSFRLCLLLLLALLSVDRASAGANAGGALLLHAKVDVEYTTTRDNYCQDFGGLDCESVVSSITGDRRTLIYVVAAFHPDNDPRLRGVAFGLRYPQNIHVVAHGSCADFELCEPAWPRSGYGTAVTWNETQSASFIPVYWLAAYNESGAPSRMELIAHERQGAVFGDDATPPRLDPIARLGALGFDMDGHSPCPGPEIISGACCLLDGSCLFLSDEECTGRNGLFRGANEPCSAVSCAPASGACCLLDGTCVFSDILSCSREPHGVWLGRDLPCAPDPCPNYSITGACCFDSGACVWTSGQECGAQSGIFYGNLYQGSCDPNPCPGPSRKGSCCLLGGACVWLTEDDCSLHNGLAWHEGVGCDPNPCPQGEIGPCCTPNGSCIATTEYLCTGTNEEDGLGVWLGYAGGCDPDPCPLPPRSGACCDLDGFCQLMTDCLCSCSGRLYLGDGVICDPNPCGTVVSGACCLPDGDCRLTPQSLCITLSGTYKGDETVCDPDPCTTGDGAAIPGACCFNDGTCQWLLLEDCAQRAGVYRQGSCDPSPCPNAVPIVRSSWGRVKHQFR